MINLWTAADLPGKSRVFIFKKRDKLRGKEIGFFKGRTCYLYEKSFNKSIIFTM